MDITAILRETALKQSRALLQFVSSSNTDFEKAVNSLFRKSLIITVGIGKSKHVAGKVADTFTSVGSPAVCLYAEQLLHGSLGIIQSETGLLFFSKSGETQELLDICRALPYTATFDIPKVVITAKKESSLAKCCDVVLSYESEECCGTNYIPTTSTTISLMLGDALAMALRQKNGFTIEDFAKVHPGGSLGEQLRQRS